MKTECTSRLVFPNPRVLIGFALYAAGLVLAFGALGSAAAEDNADVELSQWAPAQPPGRWKVTGELVTARDGHTATLLPNGQVLVAGGNDGTSGVYGLASAELYDPATGMWTVTGSMNNAREQHTATLLPNGHVLVAGGVSHATLRKRGTIRSGDWGVDGDRQADNDTLPGTRRRYCRTGRCWWPVAPTTTVRAQQALYYTIRRLGCGRRPAASLLNASITRRRCWRTGRCWWLAASLCPVVT